MKSKIKQNLKLTLYAQQRKSGATQFYLVGNVPATVTWLDGKQETVALIDRLPVLPWSNGKYFIGQWVELAKSGNNIGADMVNDLIERMECAIGETIKKQKLNDKKFNAIVVA